jgi:hypothetical protein
MTIKQHDAALTHLTEKKCFQILFCHLALVNLNCAVSESLDTHIKFKSIPWNVQIIKIYYDWGTN